jgi:branched-chain amino acid transport system ATP-binding protein
LMAISGLAPISAGDIRFEGQSIARRRPHDITRLGITHILEGRQLFADQTVADNLLLGGYTRLPRHRARVAELLEREMTRFPILRERRAQLAGTLSGGEQQMLAIARGLMSEPRLILMDEPSMGLAPLVVKGIVSTIRSLREEGATIVLVEQMAAVALRLADRAYVLENGQIKLSGTGAELAHTPEVRRAYLGG